MNTTADAMNDSKVTTPAANVVNIPQSTLLYWSIRREIWENRSIYLAPIAAATVFLVAYLIASSHLGVRMFEVSSTDPDSPPGGPFISALNAIAAILTGVSAIVGFFYSLDALYSERRDRSILFWKSLPVSDLLTVLSKVAVPMLVLPVVTFVVIVATQLLALLLGSAVLAAHGVSSADMWSAASVLKSWVVLLYMMIVLSLWYLPLIGWLLLVSAWAQRLAILWAILLPIALILIEKIGFGTFHFGKLVGERIGGAFGVAFDSPQVAQAFGNDSPAGPPQWAKSFHGSFGLTPDPIRFVSSPGLWLGLVVAVALFAAAIHLRRAREAL